MQCEQVALIGMPEPADARVAPDVRPVAAVATKFDVVAMFGLAGFPAKDELMSRSVQGAH